MTEDELNILNLQKSIQSMSNEFLKKQHEVYMLRVSNEQKDKEIDRLKNEISITKCNLAMSNDAIMQIREGLKPVEIRSAFAINLGILAAERIKLLEKELKIAHEEYARVRISQCDCCSDFPDNACYDFVSPDKE